MIDFELTQDEKVARKMIANIFGPLFREISRKYDLNEHEPVEEIQKFADMLNRRRGGGEKKKDPDKKKKRGMANLTAILSVEEMCWGDAALFSALPRDGNGHVAIQAMGTPEQKERFKDMMAAIAITEPGCGSDSAAIRTTAVLDEKTNEWVINGEKIFVSGAVRAGAIVVWATLDRSKGRAAIKNFVVEKSTPGVTLVKLEKKMGYRASDTAAIAFEDVRIPYDNLLGSPEIAADSGFKKTRQFFDMTRPAVAAIGVGIARAALEFTKEKLEEEGFCFSYTKGIHRLGAVEKTVLDMEANLDAARLLTYRAAAMADAREHNSHQASMAKAKSGKAANNIVQKCVELLGPKGYSQEWLVEKWCRDCKVNDIYEGTGQIQMLIIARNLLGFNREQLK